MAAAIATLSERKPSLIGITSRASAAAATSSGTPAGSLRLVLANVEVGNTDFAAVRRLVARTPLRLFDPGAGSPFLLSPGDRLRFVPIGPGDFEAIARSPSPFDSPGGGA